MKIVASKREIRDAAGMLMTVGFAGKTLSAELKELLRETRAAGVILFARNIESPEQVAELSAELKRHRSSGPPLAISIDQEGGRVARVKSPATEWPTMRRLGEKNDISITREVGRALGQELRAMNIDINYAPVLDVDTNPNNPIIGDRSFGSTPEVVAAHGVALISGLHDVGVAACGKHFPGHGDTDVDSHLALPRVEHSLERLGQIEWPPFARAIEAGLGAIMTAHVLVAEIDDRHPATLSPAALGPLRQQLGFDGVIVSDDIEMKAVADRYCPSEITTFGLDAGVDNFLVCSDPALAIELYATLSDCAFDTHGHQTRHATSMMRSASRMSRWYKRFVSSATTPALDVVGCETHRRLAARATSGKNEI